MLIIRPCTTFLLGNNVTIKTTWLKTNNNYLQNLTYKNLAQIQMSCLKIEYYNYIDGKWYILLLWWCSMIHITMISLLNVVTIYIHCTQKSADTHTREGITKSCSTMFLCHPITRHSCTWNTSISYDIIKNIGLRHMNL